MLSLSLIAVVAAATQGTPPATTTTQSTYVLKVSEESRSLFKLTGTTAPAAKFVLRSDSTFTFERTINAEKVSTDGTFVANAKDVILSIANSPSAMRAQLLEDRLLVDGLVYMKVTDNIAGLWVRQAANGPDRSLRFRFNDKGRFWFQQGDPKPKDGSLPLGSEGMYKVDGNTVFLYFLKIDGEDAPTSMPAGKLVISEDRLYFKTESGQRYERSEG